MRTKTIILSAAALAAGLLSSKAQVYSANVVGYVNYATPNNAIQGQANPLNVAGTPINAGTNVFPNADGHLDGVRLQFVLPSGALATPIFFSSGQPTGFEDAGGNPVSTPLLPIGTGFEIYNSSGANFTNTFVGEVAGFNSASATFSNSVSLANNAIALLGSPLPIGGQLNTTLQFSNNGAIDGLRLQKILSSGALAAPVFFSSGQPTGFEDAGGNPVPAPSLNVGESAEFYNTVGSTVKWEQKLP